MLSPKVQSSTATPTTRGHTAHSNEEDPLPNYQLDGKEIASFFGVRASNKHKAMSQGRHPSSLPKDSELWHYNKLSTQRRNRVRNGHAIFNVIEEETVHSLIPEEKKEKEKDEFTEVSRDLHFLKGSSINAQLRAFLNNSKNNDMQHLELRVDFKNRNRIYYGMSFVIMNYADEILYVNKKEELRCKSLSQIESSDRIKFKMIDLNNPSNPQPLKYGDPMYLQSMEANEAADNSFQMGSVLSAKLFGLPQHTSVNFDSNRDFT
eukprot:CAMPEP_0173225496 /NCGR_PEP_ID=MMETSP1142-20121109/4912_1 /TAXON_ID=483371 /ORGANISM="non described non described, Strain CCMP2298" /LENGTH=262 /DNA_ID=CAMNT_0014153851 /DNA_START=424 /DNA_END=1209 /DNA_ORIENTATION=-